MFQWAQEAFDQISQHVAPPPTDGPGRFAYLVQRGEEDAAMGCLAEFDPVHTCVNPGKGWYPIHVACQYSLLRLIRLLLNQPGLHLEHTDSSGNTALHHACMSNDMRALEIVKMLVNDCGANVLAKNGMNQTPYDVGTLNIVRQFLLPIQLQKETQIALDNGGQGLPPGIDLGGLRINNSNMAPPPMTFGSPATIPRTQSTGAHMFNTPTPTPTPTSRVASAPTTAPAVVSNDGYASVGGSSAAIFSSKYSKYGADGFHSSSSDVSLQQKYGHVSSVQENTVAPPPSSGNTPTAEAADANNPFSRGLPAPRYVYGPAATPPAPLSQPMYNTYAAPASNASTISPGAPVQQQPVTGYTSTYAPAANNLNTPSTPYMPPQPYQTHNYESATPQQLGFVSPAAATYGGSPAQPMTPFVEPVMTTATLANTPAAASTLFATQPSVTVEPSPVTASTPATVSTDLFLAPPPGGLPATSSPEANVSGVSDVYSAPPSEGVPATEPTAEPAVTNASDVFSAPLSAGVPATEQETKQENEASLTTSETAPVETGQDSAAVFSTEMAAEETQKEATSNESISDWEATTDPSSGQMYYFNKVTGETSWERPAAVTGETTTTKDQSSLEWVETTDPTSGQTYFFNSLTRETSWEKPAAVSSDDIGENKEWTELVDPSSGQTYYYNQTTQETSWERPNSKSKDAFSPEKTSVAVSTSDWVETADPSSGQSYYYNQLTRETSWEKPTLTEIPAPETIEKKSAAPQQAPQANSSPLPASSSDWVETVDPSSGQTYYFNQVTQETSWDKPASMEATATKTTVEGPTVTETVATTLAKEEPVITGVVATESPAVKSTPQSVGGSPFESKTDPAAASDVFLAPPSGGVPGGLSALADQSNANDIFSAPPSGGVPGDLSAEEQNSGSALSAVTGTAEETSADQVFGSSAAAEKQPAIQSTITSVKEGTTIADLDGADVGEMHDVNLSSPEPVTVTREASQPAVASTQPSADIFAAIGMPPPPFQSKR